MHLTAMEGKDNPFVIEETGYWFNQEIGWKGGKSGFTNRNRNIY